MQTFGLLKWNFGYVGYLEPSPCDKKDLGFIKGMFEKEIFFDKAVKPPDFMDDIGRFGTILMKPGGLIRISSMMTSDTGKLEITK